MATTEKMMQSRYAGKCANCGTRFPAGEWILWNTATRAARHAEESKCDPQRRAVESAKGYTATFNRQHAESDRVREAAREMARAATRPQQGVSLYEIEKRMADIEQRAKAVAEPTMAGDSLEDAKTVSKALNARSCDLFSQLRQVRDTAKAAALLTEYEVVQFALKAAQAEVRRWMALAAQA